MQSPLVIRNFDDFPEELVRLLLARARVLVAKVVAWLAHQAHAAAWYGDEQEFLRL
jgi:hypothetical protein